MFLYLNKDDCSVLDLKEEIRTLPEGTLIKYECFNEQEASYIKSKLSKEELKKIWKFTWLSFREGLSK